MSKVSSTLISSSKTASKRLSASEVPASVMTSYGNETILIDQLINDLENGKANNICKLDVRQQCNFTNWMIIATATSNRHAKALAEQLELNQKKRGNRAISVEGIPASEWILIDFFDVVVHIMLADIRERYALEKLWGVSTVEF